MYTLQKIKQLPVLEVISHLASVMGSEHQNCLRHLASKLVYLSKTIIDGALSKFHIFFLQGLKFKWKCTKQVNIFLIKKIHNGSF